MRRLTPISAVALCLFTVVISPASAGRTAPAPERAAQVRSIALTVATLDSARRFFVESLGFRARGTARVERGAEFAALTNLPGASARSLRLGLGRETIELVAFDTPGRAAPEDGHSDDGWFQHLALVTSDIDRAAQRVARHGAIAISDGPQTIPASNHAAGGIRAFYFKGPAAHPLELIWYPAGKGSAAWHARAPLALGIDHSAIAVASTDRSLGFYRDLLGLRVAGQSLNEGEEQAKLSGVAGARVRITGLRGPEGPGVELLEYLAPRRGRPLPDDSRPNDLWYAEIVIAVPELDAVVTRARAAGVHFVSDGVQDTSRLSSEKGARAVVVRDPDGHAVRLVGR